MKKILEIFQREDDALSLIRLIIFLATLELLVVTPIVIVKALDAPAYPVYCVVVLVLVFCGLYKYNVESKWLNLKLEKKEGKDE